MAQFHIFKRSVRSRHSQRLVLVDTIMARDCVDAMQRFCGQAYDSEFIAMPYAWAGSASYVIA